VKQALPLLGQGGHAGPPVRRWARSALVGPRLLSLLAATDAPARIKGDPVELPHGYRKAEDVEVSALLSAALAYGRVDLFKPRLVELHAWLGPSPAAAARELSLSRLQKLVGRFAYRMTGPEEVAALLAGAGALLREHGSLGAAFANWFTESGEPTVRGALGRLVDALVSAAPGGASRRLKHLLPHPARGSACKRLNLFLRWMVRGPDPVDFGLWRGVPAAALVMPLDTHVHRISQLIGLTRRTDLSWATAEEITARLRALDPRDPVRFDFALSHLGISGSCAARRDERRCAGCPLRPVCKHW
jgi:uncharacterized protein (TIGR02757 family)